MGASLSLFQRSNRLPESIADRCSCAYWTLLLRQHLLNLCNQLPILWAEGYSCALIRHVY